VAKTSSVDDPPITINSDTIYHQLVHSRFQNGLELVVISVCIVVGVLHYAHDTIVFLVMEDKNMKNVKLLRFYYELM
jgi:hypothetical protein